MKITDINLQIIDFELSPKNKHGRFFPSLSFIKKWNWNPNILDSNQLTQAFNIYKQKAFDQIENSNRDRVLTFIVWNDLTDQTKQIFIDAIILQVGSLIQNGLVEINVSNALSTSSFSSDNPTTTEIINLDSLNSDTIRELEKINYFEWRIINDKIYLYDNSIITSKFKNDISTNNINFSNNGISDFEILSAGKTRELIGKEITNPRTFRGVWDAKNFATQNEINNLFNSSGLPLTNGTILVPSNTKEGDVVRVKFSDESSAFNEDAEFIENLFSYITNNNLFNSEIERNTNDIADLQNGKSDNAERIILEQKVDLKIDRAEALNKIGDNTTRSQTNEVSITTLSNQFGTLNNSFTELAARVESLENQVGEFVKNEDLEDNLIDIDIDIPIVKNGNDAEIDLTGVDLSKLKVGKRVTIKINDSVNNITVFLEDSFNDGSSSNNHSLGGSLDVNFTTAKITISGDAQIINEIVSNFKAKEIEQIIGGVANSVIDNVARQDIASLNPRVLNLENKQITNTSGTTSFANNNETLISQPEQAKVDDAQTRDIASNQTTLADVEPKVSRLNNELPTFKDITSTYLTRRWVNDDSKKEVRVTTAQNQILQGQLNVAFAKASILFQRVDFTDNGPDLLNVSFAFWVSNAAGGLEPNKISRLFFPKGNNHSFLKNIFTVAKFEIRE